MERHAALRVCRVTRRETVRLVLRHEEIGVVHAEWIEDAFFKKLLERLAADQADEIADHVGGDGVVPGLAR